MVSELDHLHVAHPCWPAVLHFFRALRVKRNHSLTRKPISLRLSFRLDWDAGLLHHSSDLRPGSHSDNNILHLFLHL